MRVPNETHHARPWRIHDIAPDFTLEDVWAFPAVNGRLADFHTAIDMVTSFDPANADSLPTRALWTVRDRLGEWFGLGRISAPIDRANAAGGTDLPIPETNETSLAERLPSDLRDTAAGQRFDHLPFVPLYRTDVEFAAELSNQTVHGLMHLAWADQGNGRYQGEMAVYVKPRGRLGTGYMAIIKPLRYWVVYPALTRQIERAWNARR